MCNSLNILDQVISAYDLESDDEKFITSKEQNSENSYTNLAEEKHNNNNNKHNNSYINLAEEEKHNNLKKKYTKAAPPVIDRSKKPKPLPPLKKEDKFRAFDNVSNNSDSSSRDGVNSSNNKVIIINCYNNIIIYNNYKNK